MSEFTEIIFDFDGVLADSNEPKLDCFRRVAASYDPSEADEFLSYCKSSPDKSRFELMQALEDKLIKKGISVTYEELLNEYSDCVQKVYHRVDRVKNLDELKKMDPELTWSIVSAAPQSTLRELLRDQGELELFGGGVYGSPRSKEQIFTEEYDPEHLVNNALFIGDSASDKNVAEKFDLEFIYVEKWSRERDKWLADEADVPTYRNVKAVFADRV